MRMETGVGVERRTVYLDSSGWAEIADYFADFADIVDTAGIAFQSCRWALGISGNCSTDFAVDCDLDCRIRYSDRLVARDLNLALMADLVGNYLVADSNLHLKIDFMNDIGMQIIEL